MSSLALLLDRVIDAVIDEASNPVSICVPIYNGATFLSDCLDSIAAQTYSNFEVLMVDDGSVDDSAIIAQSYADTDARFKFSQNAENLGLVGNWNRCIEKARGRWVKFLFQDDLMAPQCLSKMLEAAAGSGGFVACSRRLLFEHGVNSELINWYERHRLLLQSLHSERPDMSGDDYSDAKLRNLEFNLVGEPSVTLIERRLFSRFGIFDPLLVQLCDGEMWNRLACNVGVRFVPTELISFRVHPSSATGSNRNREFRTWVVDALIELSRLRYHPCTAGFRELARRTGRWTSFRQKVNTSMYEAMDEARWAAQRDPPDLRPANDLMDILPCLPGSARYRWGYRIYLANRRLRQLMAKF